MSLDHEVQLICDTEPRFGCDWPTPIFARTGAEARQIGAEAGWLTNRRGGKDYCPKHRPDDHPQEQL